MPEVNAPPRDARPAHRLVLPVTLAAISSFITAQSSVIQHLQGRLAKHDLRALVIVALLALGCGCGLTYGAVAYSRATDVAAELRGLSRTVSGYANEVLALRGETQGVLANAMREALYTAEFRAAIRSELRTLLHEYDESLEYTVQVANHLSMQLLKHHLHPSQARGDELDEWMPKWPQRK